MSDSDWILDFWATPLTHSQGLWATPLIHLLLCLAVSNYQESRSGNFNLWVGTWWWLLGNVRMFPFHCITFPGYDNNCRQLFISQFKLHAHYFPFSLLSLLSILLPWTHPSWIFDLSVTLSILFRGSCLHRIFGKKFPSKFKIQGFLNINETT